LKNIISLSAVCVCDKNCNFFSFFKKRWGKSLNGLK
jgi:hypothetical protein